VGKHDAENRGEGMEEQALEIISKLQKGHAKYRSVIADLESKLMQVCCACCEPLSCARMYGFAWKHPLQWRGV
jgi:hypothetical protein